MKPAILHLGLTIEDEEYVLGTMSFNLSKDELSYHFAYPLGSPEKHLNLCTNQMESRLDHITWHDCVINLKRCNDDFVLQIRQDFFIPKSEQIKPILVQSFYLNGSDSHLMCKAHDFKWRTGQIKKIGIGEKFSDFSIILILVPSIYGLEHCFIQVKPEMICFGLDQVCTSIGRVEAFDGWDILACVSPYTIPNVIPEKVVGQQQAFNSEKPADSLNDIIRVCYKESLQGSLTVEQTTVNR